MLEGIDLSTFLGEFGIALDVGIAVVTVILIDVTKVKLRRANKHTIIGWLPLVIPSISVLVLSTHLETPTFTWHFFKQYSSEVLYCIAGTYLIYHLIWKKWFEQNN